MEQKMDENNESKFECYDGSTNKKENGDEIDTMKEISIEGNCFEVSDIYLIKGVPNTI